MRLSSSLELLDLPRYFVIIVPMSIESRGTDGKKDSPPQDKLVKAYESFGSEPIIRLPIDGAVVHIGAITKIDKNNPQRVELEIPTSPHIYRARQTYLPDIAYPHMNIPLKDQVVIEAHGYRDKNRWKFADGQDVVETVTAFNKFAKEKDISPIDIVVSCNRPEDGNTGHAEDTARLEKAGIIFVQAGVVSIDGAVYEDGAYLQVKTEYGFPNVDKKYAQQNRGESLIKLLQKPSN